MTDRMKGCWVCFDRDIREDDVEALVSAIKMLRGVAGVECEVANSEDWMARQRVRSDIQDKFLAIYKALGDSGLMPDHRG